MMLLLRVNRYLTFDWFATAAAVDPTATALGCCCCWATGIEGGWGVSPLLKQVLPPLPISAAGRAILLHMRLNIEEERKKEKKNCIKHPSSSASSSSSLWRRRRKLNCLDCSINHWAPSPFSILNGRLFCLDCTDGRTSSWAADIRPPSPLVKLDNKLETK